MIHPEKENREKFAKDILNAHIKEPEKSKIKLEGPGVETLEALFPGTKGENAYKMLELMKMAIDGFVENRVEYFPDDPSYIDESIKNSPGFKATMELLESEYKLLIDQLKHSGSFYSMRSIGHMLWDTTLPGVLGYFAALLYNQNNVAAEASPVTTIMEMYVGNELCKMLGYSIKPVINVRPMYMIHNMPEPVPAWGHITCDGSVANLEALWMARNLKFFPVSVRAALKNSGKLKRAEPYQIKLLNGKMAPLIHLDDWTILNLPIDQVLQISENIVQQYGLDPRVVNDEINRYSVQNMGISHLIKLLLPEIDDSPVSMCSATKHYSWPKGAAILGIGANNMINIKVDKFARMNLEELKKQLDNCIKHHIPVMNVVVIIGTTEESAVDPLKEVLELREKYRAQGLEFAIHADAAWGGYFRTMLIKGQESQSSASEFTLIEEKHMAQLPMSEYVTAQYKALKHSDSITIDPHKSGYIPYPAGGLCYRNSAMRNLVSFTAPVVYHGGVDPTVGVYGVEGSKPGAAAAAVYFSHRTIRPNMDGYGKLSAECYFNAKRLYAALVCLNIENLPFFITPLIPIPAIQLGLDKKEVASQYKFIRDRIVNKTNEELLEDPEAFALFKELGGDQTVITYMFSYYENGRPIAEIKKINQLNQAVYETFSFRRTPEGSENVPEIVVTSSSFKREDYGDTLLDDLRERLHVKDEIDKPINFIISTIMNPWLSKTVEGSFIPNIIEIIRSNLPGIIDQVRDQENKQHINLSKNES